LFGLRSGHTILPNASAWSARARTLPYFFARSSRSHSRP
jgi:hypothetical protein